MPTEKIYKVFVSSTYEDLREERATVQRALLQLNCLPVGMELFPAADEDTWEFIKSQIRDSDYYVVVVAGRYGSIAPDGISFTEKEYDYATSQKVPSIGFVHAEPGSISVDKSEQAADGKKKLQAFLKKLKQRPVRQFRTPHELALEVTTSFVQLIRDRPAVGYIRSNDAVDYKRYAALLEENNQLKELIKNAEHATSIFQGAETKILPLVIQRHRSSGVKSENISCTLKEAFEAVGEAALQVRIERQIIQSVALMLSNQTYDENSEYTLDEESMARLKRHLILLGLVEVASEDYTSYSYIDKASQTTTEIIWKLTEYGRRQLLMLTST
jgi:hypothetical protein